MNNCNEEMDRTSVNNDNDNDKVNVNDDNDNDNGDMMSDDNLAIGELLPIVSLKRRSATPDQVNNDDNNTNNGTAATATTATTVNSNIAIASITSCTVTVRPTRTPRSITPNLFLPILVPEEEDEHRDDSRADGEEKEGEWKDINTNNKVEEVRTEGEKGNTDGDEETQPQTETETQTPTPQKQNDSHYPAVRLFPTTKTTVEPALPSSPLPLPLLLSTPQQHKPNEEATYDDIVCHYNSLIKKQRCTPRSTLRTPKQHQHHSDYGSLSYSSSSNKGDGDKNTNGASTTHLAQPLLLSPYFLFTPDVISSPHDPPALVITNTVPIMNVDEDDDDDTMERQLCAQFSKIPSITKVLEEAEAVAVNPGYTDHNGGTAVGLGSSSFINNKTMTTKPSSVRPLRMRRRETMTSGIFRTSITGVGGVGSNGTTALPLLRKSSRLPTTTRTRTIDELL